MKASEIFVIFKLLLYVYFVLIKLGTESSLLGSLGCSLRVKIMNTTMKQEITAIKQRFVVSHLKGLQVFIVYLVCCLKKWNLLKILFDSCVKKKLHYKNCSSMLNLLESMANTEIHYSV
jgi:hypothetical protein